jgi:hypothetical protein
MRIDIKLFVLITFLTAGVRGIAAMETASPSSSGENDKKTRQIESLKERLATKVAELRDTKPAAITGKITNLTLTTLSVETKTKEIKIELSEGIRIFSVIKGKRTAIDTEDLAKGDLVSVLGQYDTTLDVLKASLIFIENEQPQVYFGTITDLDNEKFTLSFKTDTGRTYTADYEKSTKAYIYKNKEKTKSGFSKLTVGQTAVVIGFPVANEDNRISASRILALGVTSGATGAPPAASPSATLDKQ